MGLVLGRDIDSGRLASLGDLERRQGTYILGKNGTGKTTLLEAMALQDMEAGNGLLFLDPHGDITEKLLRKLPQHRRNDLILMDLANRYRAIALNFFQCADPNDLREGAALARLFEELLHKRWDTSWGPRVAQIVRNCAQTLIANPGHTVLDVRRLLLDDAFRARLVGQLKDTQVKEFWELQYNPLSPTQKRDHTESTLNKIDELLTPSVRSIVGQSRSSIDFRAAMDEGKIILVKMSLGELSQSDIDLLGTIVVALVFRAAVSRFDMPESQRRLFAIFADEYSRFCTPAFAELLTEARKTGVATTVAHQTRQQLDESNQSATLNAANLVVFAVIGEDGKELAQQFDRHPPSPDPSGQRPKYTICQDAVGHLLKVGHEQKEIRNLVAQEISPLARELAESNTKEYATRSLPYIENLGAQGVLDPAHFTDKGLYYSPFEALQAGMLDLNTYIVEAMEGRLEPSSKDSLDRLTRIACSLRGVLGIAKDRTWNGALWKTHYPQIKTFTAMYHMAKELSENHHIDDAMRLLVSVRAIDLKLDLVRGFKMDEDEKWNSVQARAWYEAERFVSFLLGVSDLATRLYADPIMVPSGQYEPDYDRSRTFSDVESEIANDLVNQSAFHATCRLVVDGVPQSFRILTPSYVIEDESHGFSAVEELKRQSQERYGRPIEDIEREIQERRRNGDDDDDGEPPTSRRVKL